MPHISVSARHQGKATIVDLGEESGQVEIAVNVLLGLLRMQAERPGCVPLDYLPNYVRLAGNERERQGDFGAARLLGEWADALQSLA